MQGQFARLGQTMEAARNTGPEKNKIDAYGKQMQAIQELRHAMNLTAQASGQFHTQTVQTISASEKLTNQIRQQKIGFMEANKQLRAYKAEMRSPGKGNSVLGEAIREQQALRNSMATQWTGNAFGKNKTDLIIPKNIGGDLNDIHTKLGMINRMLYSAAQNTVNWGKNTQWAGRQIMVGLTVPLGMALVGAGVLAAKVDAELTRVAKVYDTTATTVQGQERELAQLREKGLEQAKRMANEYGMALKDTINIQGQLAATGLKGSDLFASTAETGRIATLGEMDTQSAIDFTVALQTAFRDTIKTTDDLSEAFNFFNSIENATSLSLQDIAEATPRAASAMAALGVTAQEMTVMLTAMKESGVDAAEAANALKSGATKILDPTPEALKYFSEYLNIDLKESIDSAEGNMFKFMENLAVALHGKDAQTVQTGVSKLFGTYQFNRDTALLTNLGDAIVDGVGQTAKAYEMLGQSAEEHAGRAASEIERLQESISHKFKAAVQGVAAELVPIGEVALKIGTFFLKYLIQPIIEFFNGLNGWVKIGLLALLGLVGVAGPLLMITGIFANLLGSIMKVGLQVGNLRYKFKALTAEEAASAINARTASSMFNTEAAAAANLAGQVNLLTAAFERNAMANGQMMTSGGMIGKNVNGVQRDRTVRKVEGVSGNSSYVYGHGSRSENGTPLAGRRADPADVDRFKEMESRSAKVADSAEKTKRSYEGVGKAMIGIAGAAAVFGVIAAGSSETANKWVNIAFSVAMVAALIPVSFWTSMAASIKAASASMLLMVRGVGSGAFLRNLTLMRHGFSLNGMAGLKTAVSSFAPTLARIAPLALRIFGPIGILATGALITKKIVDNMTEMNREQQALATTSKNWSDIMGYTDMPGAINIKEDEDAPSSYAKRIENVNKLIEANEDFVDVLKKAGEEGGKFGRLYEMALQQALRAASRGASPEQAREIFQTTIQAAIPDQAVVDKLTLRFRKEGIDLENPEEITNRLNEILGKTLGSLGTDIDIRPGAFRAAFGGDLTSEVQKAATGAGQALADAMNAAGDDKGAWADMFQDLTNDSNALFGNMIKDARKNSDELDEVMSDLGLKTADELSNAMDEAIRAVDEGNATPLQERLAFLRWNDKSTIDFANSYEEFLDHVVDGWARMMGITDEDEIEELRNSLGSLFDFKDIVGAGGKNNPKKEILSVATAMGIYDSAIQDTINSGEKMSDQQKTDLMNYWRVQAGLEEVTHWTEGWGDAAIGAARDAKQLENAFHGISWAADSVMQVTPDQLAGSYKDAMSGAWGDILSEAGRRYDEHNNAIIENIQAGGEALDKQWDIEEKNQGIHFDILEKDLEAHWTRVEKEFEDSWETRTKGAENFWDTQEKLAEKAAEDEDKAYDVRIEGLENERNVVADAYDARIKAIEDTMDAEAAAEVQRQKIFDAEQQRIERMAERLNTNIDFNMALNSGDMDQAAKIANDASARDQQWSMDDANDDIVSAVDKREAELNAQIDLLNLEKDARDVALSQEIDRIQKEQEARREWHTERMDQIRLERDANLEALKTQEEFDRENLRLNRANDQERLNSARTTAEDNLTNNREKDRLSTESAVNSQKAITESDKLELANRLRVLQEFIPTNEAEYRQHVADIEALYREYGIELTTQGNGWAQAIGTALQTNIDVAAAALQNGINWTMIAQNIAAQIGEGMGMTMGQVTEFLKTGNWPAGVQPKPPAYKPANFGLFGDQSPRAGLQVARHTGGEVPYTGSQADRVGVPRSASPYPSEVPMLAKAGEFVVKARQARKNKGLLQTINNGDGKYHAVPHHSGGEVNLQANDIGGPSIAEYAIGNAALSMMTYAKVAQVVAQKKVEQGAEAYAMAQAAQAGGGSTGTIDGGGGMIYQRLFSTIKRAFPRANLNDGYSNRPGMHGKGQAVDLGEQGFAGGAGRPYLAAMNRWIYDNFGGSTQLIYNGLGDDRPNLLGGRDHAYDAATQAGHRNHVHWGMDEAAVAAAGRTGILAAAGGANYGAGTVQQQVQAAANQRGWGSGANWDAISWVIGKESSWNPNAQNPTSTASGLFQHIDATWNAYKAPGTAAKKMRLASVAEQAYAGMNYFGGRYGSPAAARTFWERNHWYDQGGYLQPGATMAMNATGKPEPVFTGPQWDILKANIGNATFETPGSNNVPVPVKLVDANVATGGQILYDIDIDLRGAYIKEEVDLQAAVEKAIDNRNARNGRKRVI